MYDNIPDDDKKKIHYDELNILKCLHTASLSHKSRFYKITLSYNPTNERIFIKLFVPGRFGGMAGFFVFSL